MTIEREQLFTAADEREFKRKFVIQFIASLEAVNYVNNCRKRRTNEHRLAIHDAPWLADQAWQVWKQEHGLSVGELNEE